MNYPLISEYVEAIKSAGDNLEELSYLRPVLDDDGLPVITSGNFAVVFKMKDEQSGKFYAVKCFTKEQKGRAEAYREIAKELENVSSSYLVSIQYLEKELFVDTNQTTETKFPVLLMDWVEGKTLDKYLRENLDDKYALEMLAYRFSQLAQWLIPQPFAHGDLKPDNILVREDGSLVLVDYDGMYVPAMKGQKARELGSPDFRHPLRTENNFDEQIDDFSLVVILFSLKAISLNPKKNEIYYTGNSLLFSNIIESSNFKKNLLIPDNIINRLKALFFLILGGERANEYLMLFDLYEPYLYDFTEVTKEDLASSWVDESGVTYNKDGTKLLKGALVNKYKIREGTIYICNDAFYEDPFSETLKLRGNEELTKIVFPDSVKIIGSNAFADCKKLKKIHFSNHLSIIGRSAFNGCVSLEKLTLPDSVITIDERAFQYCESLKKIVLPFNLKAIKNNCFYGCNSLKFVIMNNNIVEIGNRSFGGCKKLVNFSVPQSVESIGYHAFGGCNNLILFIPQTVRILKGDIGCSFEICKRSKYLILENGVIYNHGKDTIFAFLCKYDYKRGHFVDILPEWAVKKSIRVQYETGGYDDLDWPNVSEKNVEMLDVKIPNGIKYIGEYAFYGKGFLESIIIPESVTGIGDNAFCNNDGLKTVFLPDSLTNYNLEQCFNDSSVDVVVPIEVANKMKKDNYRSVHIYYDYEKWFRNNSEQLCVPKEMLERFIQNTKQQYGYLTIYEVCGFINNLTQYRNEIIEEIEKATKNNKECGKGWHDNLKTTLELYEETINDILLLYQNIIKHLKKTEEFSSEVMKCQRQH